MEKNHRKTKLSLFAVGALVGLLTACSPDAEHGPNSGQFSSGNFSEKAVSFFEIQQSIMVPHCVQCHDRYANYNAVLLELDEIVDSIQTGRMPKGKSVLSPEVQTQLITWVNSGAPFKAAEPPPPPIELKPSWESVSARIFEPHCTACHSENGEVPWLDFTTYENVFTKKDELFNTADPIKSYMIEVILDPVEPMPPLESNVKSLNQEQLRVLLDWIGQGLPES